MEEAAQKLIWQQTEDELDLCVLYAIGDASGPLANEVRLGVASRKSFAQQIKQIQMFRSREIAIRLDVVVRGKARAEQLKTSLAAHLKEGGRQSLVGFWRVLSNDAELASIVAALAYDENIETMTQDQAIALERATLARNVAEWRRNHAKG